MNISNLNLPEHHQEIKQSFIQGEMLCNIGEEPNGTEPDETKQMVSVKIVCEKVEKDSDIGKCKAIMGIKIKNFPSNTKSSIQFQHLGTIAIWDTSSSEGAELVKKVSEQLFNDSGANAYFDLDFKGRTPIHSLEWQYRTMKAVQQDFADKINAKIPEDSLAEEIPSATYKL